MNAVPERRVVEADLSISGIPFGDNHFDIVTAHDFLEHIPRVLVIAGKTVFPFVRVMTEINRVLAPGGILYSKTPVYPSKEAFQDPTHTNFVTEDTFRLYFCGDSWARDYGFVGNFDLEFQIQIGGHLYSLMRKRG